MVEDIQRSAGNVQRRGHEVTAHMNILLHGGPDSAAWNVAPIDANSVGHSPSKILNRPDLCDEVCQIADPMLQVAQSMMLAYFPFEKSA